MGRVQKRKANTSKNKQLQRARRTFGRTKDLDQVADDLKPENYDKLKNQPLDLDLPGNGEYYCVHCARYFISEKAIDTHFISKEHKKRIKVTKETPYTQKEAEMAVGLL